MRIVIDKIRNNLIAGIQRFRNWKGFNFADPPGSELMPEAVAFQSDLEELIAEAPPRHLDIAHVWAACMFVTLIVVASVIKVDTVVVATGRLMPDTPPIVLQPIERGIIRELLVKPGDKVAKGQVLATLDPTFAQADMASLSQQQRTLLAQLRRLEMEASGRPYTARNTADPDELLQATLYRQRQAQYQSKLEVFSQEIDRLEASMKSSEDDRNSLSRQLSIAREAENMRAALMQTQTGSKLQLMEAQTVRMRTERDYQSAINRLVELRHAVDSKKAERQAFTDEWSRQLLEELVRIRTEVNRVDENLAKAVRIHDLVVVVAPENGVVLEVAKRSVGSVLQGGEALITLVPSDVAMIADVAISSADIGFIKPGDDAIVKVDAFPFQKHGWLEGKLRSISQDSGTSQVKSSQDSVAAALGRTSTPDGAFHRAQVTIKDLNLRKVPEGVQLIAGMTVSAEIKVGARSVIGFFLYPLTRGLTESMREP